MSLSTTTCHVAKCDDCGDGWSDEDYGPLHYSSLTALAEELWKAPDDDGIGWSFANDVVRCRTCTERHACATDPNGHQWSDWMRCRCGQNFRANRHTAGMTSEHRSCTRCDKYVSRDVPGECETIPPPVALSQAAQLVQWRRNHDLYVTAGRGAEDGRVGDEDLPEGVRALIVQAVALVAEIDAVLAR